MVTMLLSEAAIRMLFRNSLVGICKLSANRSNAFQSIGSNLFSSNRSSEIIDAQNIGESLCRTSEYTAGIDMSGLDTIAAICSPSMVKIAPSARTSPHVLSSVDNADRLKTYVSPSHSVFEISTSSKWIASIAPSDVAAVMSQPSNLHLRYTTSFNFENAQNTRRMESVTLHTSCTCRITRMTKSGGNLCNTLELSSAPRCKSRTTSLCEAGRSDFISSGFDEKTSFVTCFTIHV